jgi:hypothetical protein
MGRAAAIGAPQKSTSPLSGRTGYWVTMLKSVELADPFRAGNPEHSSLLTENDTSSTAVSAPNDLVRFFFASRSGHSYCIRAGLELAVAYCADRRGRLPSTIW